MGRDRKHALMAAQDAGLSRDNGPAKGSSRPSDHAVRALANQVDLGIGHLIEIDRALQRIGAVREKQRLVIGELDCKQDRRALRFERATKVVRAEEFLRQRGVTKDVTA